MPRGNGGVIGPANIPTTSVAKGVWSLMEQQLAQRQGIWPTVALADPYFEYTTLLLPGTGTNGAQNNTFLDSSSNTFTITRNGNTTQGTFSPFSQTGWGNYFNGSSQYLTVPNGTFVLGSNNFVIEAFVYINSVASSGLTVAVGQTDAATAGGSSWDFTVNQTSATLKGVLWIGGSATVITSVGAVPLNQWVHVAFVRTGGTASLFINGSKDGTNTGLSTSSVQTGSTSYPPTIGRNGTGSYFNGYISNLRVIIGAGASSVYNATNSSITVPTSPLTAVTNTIVLTCQSNRFVDNSSSPVTVTPNNSISVVAFSPFNPSAAYSAATNGGSGYFDGTGDYLTAPNNTAFDLGSSDFTISLWYYPLVSGNTERLVQWQNGSAVNANYGWYLFKTTANQITFGTQSGGSTQSGTSSSSVQINAWNYIVVTRTGTSATIYVNGVSTSISVYSTIANPSGSLLYISSDAGGGQNVQGYLAGLRILKGTADTPSSTNPTAPPTNITNTSLLLNFTNAGVYDATGKNVFETVGNAQISTTQSKWGGSSIYLDGTGDYLTSPSNNLVSFGTGDFTVEFWVNYASAIAYSTVIVSTWFIEFSNTRGLVFYDGLTGYTRSYTVATSQWYHVAVSKQGTNLRFFVDGVQQGATVTSYTYNITNASTLEVGRGQGGLYPVNGYIQDLRITKGYARYTTNFTPPTAAFPLL